jgi:hypothetical protein
VTGGSGLEGGVGGEDSPTGCQIRTGRRRQRSAAGTGSPSRGPARRGARPEIRELRDAGVHRSRLRSGGAAPVRWGALIRRRRRGKGSTRGRFYRGLTPARRWRRVRSPHRAGAAGAVASSWRCRRTTSRSGRGAGRGHVAVAVAVAVSVAADADAPARRISYCADGTSAMTSLSAKSVAAASAAASRSAYPPSRFGIGRRSRVRVPPLTAIAPAGSQAGNQNNVSNRGMAVLPR